MKKKLYQLTALLLSLAMLFAFAGCGKKKASTKKEEAGTLVDFEDETTEVGGDTDGDGTDSDGNSGSGGGNGGGATVEKPVEMTGSDPFANIPKRLKGTTVTFAVWGDEGADMYKKILTAFEKKTGIKAKFKTYNEGEYISLIAKDINGGNAPDVFICNGILPQAAEIAQPLNNILNLNDDFWADIITERTTIAGKTYFVNSFESCWMDYQFPVYNKKIFSDYGLTTPTDYYKQGKWTYENYKKCLEQVKATGNIGGMLSPTTMATAMGTPVVSLDVSTMTFKNNLTATAPAFQFAARIFKEGLWSSTAWWGTFASGQIGLYMDAGRYGVVSNGYMKDTTPSDLAAVPLPTSYQGNATKQVVADRCYGIAKGAKNPEGAAYFLRYWLDYEYYEKAGVDPFMNNSVKKVYFEDVMPLVKKEGANIDYWTVCSRYGGIPDEISQVTKVDEAQVGTELAKHNGAVQNAVNKYNDKINQYK